MPKRFEVGSWKLVTFLIYSLRTFWRFLCILTHTKALPGTDFGGHVHDFLTTHDRKELLAYILTVRTRNSIFSGVSYPCVIDIFINNPEFLLCHRRFQEEWNGREWEYLRDLVEGFANRVTECHDNHQILTSCCHSLPNKVLSESKRVFRLH